MNNRGFSWSVLLLMSCGVLLLSPAIPSAYAQTAETATVGADAPQPPIATPLKWESSGVLVRPISDESHAIVSVKDPTVVQYDDRWHIYATAYSTSARTWSMVYLNFKDWSEAPNAKLTYIDVNPSLKGYHCAPHLFYFTPHKKWYLIFQSQQPQYCTTDDISKPEAPNSDNRPREPAVPVPGSRSAKWRALRALALSAGTLDVGPIGQVGAMGRRFGVYRRNVCLEEI